MKKTPIKSSPTKNQTKRREIETETPRNRSLGIVYRYAWLFGVAAFMTANSFAIPEGAIRYGDYLPIAFFFLIVSAATIALKVLTAPFFSSVETHFSAPIRINSRAAKVADYSLAIFVVLITVSYLRACLSHSCDVRYSTNAYWTFLIPCLFYFCIRFFGKFASSKTVYALCALIVACAVAESSYSLYSYAVVNPRLRAQYQADPETMLKENGFDFAPNSRERALFENRLLSSSEPTGSYGLANTLAGILAPALIIALLGFPFFGALTRKKRNESTGNSFSSKLAGILWITAIALIAFILLTTKSRAGVLATLTALTFWGVVKAFSQHSHSRVKRFVTWLLISSCVCVFAIVGLSTLGVLDKEVFTEAGKSLGYRLDYWRSTLLMIEDHPLFGVGPGEFQSVYAKYILPTASEFIADPHNFAFELAALFGLPSLFAFLLFLGVVCSIGFRVVLNGENQTEVSKCERRERTLTETSGNREFFVLLFGSIFGCLIAFLASFFQSAPISPSFYLTAIFSISLVLLVSKLLFRSVQWEPSRSSYCAVFLAALLAIVVNLLAAGGIGYPCVSALFFLLAGLIVSIRNNGENNGDVHVDAQKNKLLQFVPLASVIIVFALFYTTAFKPRCNSFAFETQGEPTGTVLAALKRGETEKIDDKSLGVAEYCYFLAGQEYLHCPSDKAREHWDNMRDQLKRVSPNSSSSRERCGDFDADVYRRNPIRNEFLKSALDFYQESVERSPTDVVKRAKLASALRQSGDIDSAVDQAREALRFDAITPHKDRKLPEDLRKELVEIVDLS